MKLSALKSKLGLAADATEAQVNTALEAAVTLANEAMLANGGPGSGPRQKGQEFTKTPSAISAYHAGHYVDGMTGDSGNPDENKGGFDYAEGAKLHADAAQRFEKAAKENPDDKDYHEAKAAHHWELASKYSGGKTTKPAANEGTSEGAPATFLSMVNELVRSKGLSFNDAWANVKMEHPEQYQAMSRPAAVK
jgi:hypothetical protein